VTPHNVPGNILCTSAIWLVGSLQRQISAGQTYIHREIYRWVDWDRITEKNSYLVSK